MKNATKKIFRFKYEPCLGTCYTAPDDDRFPELGELEVTYKNKLIQKMVDAHNSTCDDPNQSFGVDFDQNSRLFVGYFRDAERTHMFSSKTFLEMVETLCSFVSEFNKNKQTSNGDCIYGLEGDENLFEKINSQTVGRT